MRGFLLQHHNRATKVASLLLFFLFFYFKQPHTEVIVHVEGQRKQFGLCVLEFLFPQEFAYSAESLSIFLL